MPVIWHEEAVGHVENLIIETRNLVVCAILI